jgi:hypothetical protein
MVKDFLKATDGCERNSPAPPGKDGCFPFLGTEPTMPHVINYFLPLLAFALFYPFGLIGEFGAAAPEAAPEETARNFLVKREMAAKQAVLRGKSDIIRFVSSGMSAMDQIGMPGTDLYAALNQEYEAVGQRIEA